ncbi:uncharacterized protein LOC118328124 [Morone saxatilis]|uniref:uncharacterized protein LOC118328124 n=1 Tax=Morone saxatilis TaxID=34816 RepID=UPI0015E1FC89|nr:uncharacterized protein LOC118328124 [Morone saxatilis]
MFKGLSGENVRDPLVCRQLTGTELLKMSPQSSPARHKCKFICTHLKLTSTNPFPYTAAIVEKESNSGLTQSAVITTTGSTVSRPHASTPITPAKQTSPNRITGLTVGRPSNTDSFISTSLIPVKPSVALTLNTASTKASLFPETSSETWIRKSIIVVAGFGVTVGVISLGLGLFCTKRRTEGCSYKRKQTNVTDDFMYMINLDYEGLFSADNDKANDVITSLPGLECPTGSDKPNRREPQTEDSDIYHVYCTIPDDPPPSALKDMVYSTVQTH